MATYLFLLIVLLMHMPSGHAQYGNSDSTPILDTCSIAKLNAVHTCYDLDGAYVTDINDDGFVERGTVCRHILCGVLQNAECSIAGRWVGHDGIELGFEMDSQLWRYFGPVVLTPVSGATTAVTNVNRKFQDSWKCMTLNTGEYTSQDRMERSLREKRGWVRIRFRIRRWFGRRRRTRTTPAPPNVPPSYITCPPGNLPSRKVFTAPRGQTSVRVSWTTPTTSADAISNTQISGPRKRELIKGLPGNGRRYDITYVAKDAHAASASCNFYFYVKYLQCGAISSPENGKNTHCSNGYIYGSYCYFTCNTGFEMHGSRTARCQKSEEWTPKPTCEKTLCQEPFQLLNGQVICDDNVYEFEDRCYFKCNTGFKLSGKQKMVCQASQKWSVSRQEVTCLDDTPPVIDCETYKYQTFYIGVIYTTIYWNEPTATDNVDPNPSLVNVAGPKQGDTLTEGAHNVSYTSTDEAGNTVDCQITLDVVVIRCESGPIDVLSKPNFMSPPICNGSTYFYGVHCTLGCELNLPLKGSTTMACEKDSESNKGVWTFGNETEPYCEYVDCPPVDPPWNGGLVYNTVQARPLYTMICPVGLDSPYVNAQFVGDLTCQDDGTWYPIQAFPTECVEPSPFYMVLSNELFYEGDCSDTATQDMIKNNMINYLSGIKEDFKSSICPDVTTCSVSNLVVVCGSVRRRRDNIPRSFRDHNDVKRQAQTGALVYWDTEILFVTGDKSDNEAYNYYLGVFDNMTQITEANTQNGNLSMDGFALPMLQTAGPNFRCDPGYTRVNLVCKPCTRGMYLNSSTENCEFCPLGTHINTTGAVECDPCPTGYSTAGTGSVEETSCIKMCGPGFVSYNSIEPCAACPLGSYQPASGKSSCNVCPFGTTTSHANSTAENECQYFDIQIGNVNGNTLDVPFTTSRTSVITISTWLKRLSTVSPSLSIHVGDLEDRLLYLELDSFVSLKAGGIIVNTSVQLSVDHWTHILATLDMEAGTLHIYIDGDLISTTNAINIDMNRQLSNGSVAFDAGNNNAVLLSGFAVHPLVLSDLVIEQINTMCQSDVGSEVFTMEDIRSLQHDAITPIVPASCDPIDECANEPCGDFECVNNNGPFTCICNGGWSGLLCDIPPDYCIDNACDHGECISTDSTYICNCTEWYTGVFCTDPPVSGGWSEWGSWNSCNVTCDGGMTARGRICDNPLTGPGGQDCQGLDTDMQQCNIETCPECGPLRRAFGSSLQCIDNPDSGLKECNVTCVNGKAIPAGQTPSGNYSCGLSTGYEWQPTDKLIPCISVSPPLSFSINSDVTYTLGISEEHKTAVIEQVNDKFKDKTCVQSRACDVITTLHSEKRRKRSISTSTIFVTITTVFDNLNNIGIEQYYDNGTASSGLLELQNAETSLREIYEFIQNNTDDVFTVTIGSEVYNIDIDTFSIESIVQCLSGYSEVDGSCVQCPEGTYETFGTCHSCAIGTYQSVMGQTSCDVCPNGYTTLYYGSEDISECSIPYDIDIISSTPQAATTDIKEDGPIKVTVIVVAVAAGVFAVVVVIAVYVLYKKYVRKEVGMKKRQGSFVSLSMVRPATHAMDNRNMHFKRHV